MPDDACLRFYDCPSCGARLRPREGDCCVFCSYGDRECPPRRAELRKAAGGVKRPLEARSDGSGGASAKVGTYYYRRESGGAFTNLQMYSRRVARRMWRRLEADYARDGENTDNLKERCAFILSAMGLSVSQLLGQNNPTEPNDPERLPQPLGVLKALEAEYGLDSQLVADFERFVGFYDAIRHFGVTPGGSKHRKLDDLSFAVAREGFNTCEHVWRAVLRIHQREFGADLDDLDFDFDSERAFYEEDDPNAPSER